MKHAKAGWAQDIDFDDADAWERALNRVNKVGAREGWGLFECCSPEHPEVELQRDDCPDAFDYPPFEDDDQALAFVKAKADEGYSIHRLALQMVDQANEDFEAEGGGR